MIRDNTSVSHQGAGRQKRHYKVCCSKLQTPWIVPSPAGRRDSSVSCSGLLASPFAALDVQLQCSWQDLCASWNCKLHPTCVLRSSDQKVAGSRCAPASQHLQILLVRFSFTTSTEWPSLASQFANTY